MRLVATLATDAECARPPAWADLVEVRLDLVSAAAAERVLRAAGPFAIATLRSRAHGGAFEGTAASAAARLLEAVRCGAAWVDAEPDVAPLVLAPARAAGARVLASVHAPGGEPAPGADAWKVARPVADAASFRAVRAEASALAARSARGETPPASLVPYGPLAAGLRVLAAAAAQASGGDPFVFAGASDRGADASLPAALRDQPDGLRLLDDLRLGEVSPGARLFALLGRPGSRSPSPALHAAVFRATGTDALYLPEIALPPREAFALPLDGASVTTPWKEEAAALCAWLDPLAAASGAANTVMRAGDGTFLGWNTDASAVAEALGTAGVTGGTGRILGGGGFARAAAVALRDAGVETTLVGGERARAAARALGVRHAPWGSPTPDVLSVLVNATPLGADGSLPPEAAAAAAAASERTLVLDAPYAAGVRRAAFAARAAGGGARVVDGPALLALQGVRQAAIFCGREPPPGVVEASLAGLRTLVLAGLRGSGKSSVGRAVARRLGRPFVDTDAEVERRTGRPAGRVLAVDGEDAFRAVERRAVLGALERRGAVVATGGGALTSEGAESALGPALERSFVLRLRATPETAAARARADPASRPPLVPGESPEAEGARLAAERGPRLDRLADAFLDTDGRGVDELAAEAARLWLAAAS